MVLIVHQYHQCHLSMLWYQIDGLMPGLLNNIGGAMLLCIFYCVPWLRRAATAASTAAAAFAAVARPTTHELASHGLWFEWCRKSLQILKLFAALHIFLACKNSCFYICGCQVSTCLLMPGPCFTGLLPVCIGMYNLLLQVATRSLQLHFHIGPIITVGGHPYITSAHFWILLDPPTLRFLLYVLFWFLVDRTVHFHYCITLPIISTVWKKSGLYC